MSSVQFSQRAAERERAHGGLGFRPEKRASSLDDQFRRRVGVAPARRSSFDERRQ
jgi:hypothetical protein